MKLGEEEGSTEKTIRKWWTSGLLVKLLYFIEGITVSTEVATSKPLADLIDIYTDIPASRSYIQSRPSQTRLDQTHHFLCIDIGTKLTIPGKRAQYVRPPSSTYPHHTDDLEPTIRQRYPRTRRQAKDVSHVS